MQFCFRTCKQQQVQERSHTYTGTVGLGRIFAIQSPLGTVYNIESSWTTSPRRPKSGKMEVDAKGVASTFLLSSLTQTKVNTESFDIVESDRFCRLFELWWHDTTKSSTHPSQVGTKFIRNQIEKLKKIQQSRPLLHKEELWRVETTITAIGLSTPKTTQSGTEHNDRHRVRQKLLSRLCVKKNRSGSLPLWITS